VVKKAVIIGGGIIGSSVAWRLAREGLAVTVLERGRLGREASWAAAGMIAAQADTHAPGPLFDLCLRARDVLAATVETLRVESPIDPEYDHAGILYLTFDAAERGELEQRGRWQLAAGGAVEELSPAAARKLEPAISPDAVYALHFPMDRRVDNRKLTQAYTAAAIIRGATFVEGASVDSVIVNHGRAEAVRCHGGRLHHADVIINAAGSWAGQIRGLESDKVETHPVRGQMVCFDARPGTLGPSVFSSRGYLVQRRDGRILAGSTTDEAGYDKSITLAGLEKITRGALANVPALGAIPFREAWAGLRPATRDLLPVLGPSPSIPNVFYATGHFRSGILLSAITGELLADLSLGRTPAIDLTPFSPARFTAAGVKVLGLVRDILLRSRIDAAAQALGLEVAYSPALDHARARAAELQPKMVFADLSDPGFPADGTAREIRAAAQGARLIGFASHVDLKSFADARTAGFDLTLSRSEFTARLPDLLNSSKSG
jgi:glycine oxidase